MIVDHNATNIHEALGISDPRAEELANQLWDMARKDYSPATCIDWIWNSDFKHWEKIYLSVLVGTLIMKED